MSLPLRSRLGLMQGRLTPPVNGRIQAFPAERWREEFPVAGALGLSAIEWIVESPLDDNPLWSADGVAQIRQAIESSNTRVDFVCADYFMEVPFVRTPADVKRRNQRVLRHLVAQSAAIGAQGVEIPFVDHSAITTIAEEDEACEALEPCLAAADRHGVVIGLETSLPAPRVARLCRTLDHPSLRVTYDIGNSASLGHDPGEEIETYGPLIANVHVKDRVRGGGTVPLGSGDADLRRAFALLQRQGYSGSFTLQAARNGDERRAVSEYVGQVRGWLEDL